MATTGTALFPGASTFPNTNVYPGQGDLPMVRAQISTDDVSDPTPTWTNYESRLRSFSVSRGRTNELSEFDAGNATIVLDNRDRTLDPNINANIRPLNRLRLYVEFSGVVNELFRGYAESWTQQWDQSGIYDATITMVAADEFKVLSQAALPTTDPPRDSYAALVAFDQPVGYWDFNDDPASRQQGPTELAPWEPSAPEDPTWLAKDGRRRADLRIAPKRPRKR